MIMFKIWWYYSIQWFLFLQTVHTLFKNEEINKNNITINCHGDVTYNAIYYLLISNNLIKNISVYCIKINFQFRARIT